MQRKKSFHGKALKQLQSLFGYSMQANEKGTADINGIAEEHQYVGLNTRRKFMGDIAKTAALAGVAGIYQSCISKNESTQPTIAIVGAGMAGLHASYILKQAGYASTLYEATQRAGGRIFTVTDMMGPGLWTEMGGEFIDTNHVDMLNLCKQFKLPLIDRHAPTETTLKEFAYFFEGNHFQQQDVLKELHPFTVQMAKDIESLSDEISFDKHTDADKRLDNMSIADYTDSIGVKGWFRNFLHTAYTTEYGSDASEQSALNMLSIFDTGDEKNFSLFGESDEIYSVDGGNNRLCEAMAKELEKQMAADHFLTAISQKNNKYQLTFKNSSGTNKDIAADIVILALPFTLLREVDIQLNLPEWKTNAIQKQGYGMNSKLFIGVKERIWRKQGYAGYSFTDNAVMNGYDHTQMQQRNEGSGGYTINLGGKASIDCGSKSLDDLKNQLLPAMEGLFPGSQTAFNDKFQRWYWPGFPFSKCSYTSFKPGQYTTICGAEIKPVDNLFFAGEHCSYAFQGFMNGAAHTGRIAAEAIISKLKAV